MIRVESVLYEAVYADLRTRPCRAVGQIESLEWCLTPVPAPVSVRLACEPGGLQQSGSLAVFHSGWPYVTSRPHSEMSRV